MKKLFNTKVIVISAILLAVVSCLIVLYSFTHKSTSNTGNILTTLLEAPFFISSAKAVDVVKAFPMDQAGMAAYIKVNQKVDIKMVTPIFTKIVELGDNYTIGILPIPNLGGNVDTHLYADTDGWVVAYLERGEPSAKMMQWGTIDLKKPEIGAVKSTVLEEALYKVGDAVSTRILSSDIKYYNFKFPDANSITLFVKTKIGEGSNIMQMEIPVAYTLYEASYYHYVYDYTCCFENATTTSLKVDGIEVNTVIANDNVVREFGSYDKTIKTGNPYNIEISSDRIESSAGVTTVLIYKAQ